MDNNRPLYQIHSLHCAYGQGATVLAVPELSIQAGQIVIVLGKSGSGKSTFLESLALMNDTIKSGEVLFTPPSTGESFELSTIWRAESENMPAAIRAAHYSFVFQQTNLMSHFTVPENIYITMMIQGAMEADCAREAESLMKRIGLDKLELSRKVTELSGGQRQRVAFARAIIAGFDVLFGDEPTGNLDDVNANEIMSMLVDYIHHKENTYPKTAIIVTHNIDLALQYADAILIINKEKGLQHGYIDSQALYLRNNQHRDIIWTNGQLSYPVQAFREFLVQHFYLQ